MNLTKRKKPKNRRNKIFILSLALLMCMSLFIFPMTAYAANENAPVAWASSSQSERPAHVAPPTVEAEIIGSLLRIRATSGYYAVEAVYVNERRFNHRVDSALVIDISGYIAAGDTISVHAVDFAGNYSNTVLLSPPVPAQPPAPNNITPEGHGELLDHLASGDNIEFITIETPTGSIFYLIIDHTRSSNNVYFLNPVTEWDLLTLAAAAELPVPDYIHQPQPTTEPVVVEKDPPTAETPTPEPTQEPAEDEGGGKGGMYIFLAIAGVAAFGVIYYLKILKPKKEREMYGGGEDGEQEDADAFEDVDESEEVITSEEPGESEDLSDGYNVDDGEYYKEGDESK